MSICVLHLRKQQSHRLQVKPSQSISSCDSKRHPHPFGKVATGISGKVIALRGSLVFWAWCCPGGLGGRASNESLQQSSIFSSSRHLLVFRVGAPGEKRMRTIAEIGCLLRAQGAGPSTCYILGRNVVWIYTKRHKALVRQNLSVSQKRNCLSLPSALVVQSISVQYTSIEHVCLSPLFIIQRFPLSRGPGQISSSLHVFAKTLQRALVGGEGNDNQLAMVL